jgi:hypothetical protein
MRRWRARRGAALFIVVLVILSLTGVAIFAARSAAVDVSIAGRYRQSTVTHQVARLGMQTTISELGRDPTTYVRAMKDTTTFGGPPSVDCEYEMKMDVTGTQSMDTGGCFRFAYDGVQTATQASAGNSVELMQPPGAGAEQPSSIGLSDTRPNFAIEMTDKVQLPWPVPGFEGGMGSNMRFYAVTLTGTGQIVPRDPAAPAGSWGTLETPDAANSYKASVEMMRAQVVVGPLPQGL